MNLFLIESNMQVVLFEPEIIQNLGAIIRICSCFDLDLIIIEPLGFIFDMHKIRRITMNYRTKIFLVNSFENFLEEYKNNNKVLFTVNSSNYISDYVKFNKLSEDSLLIFGKESMGVPDLFAKQCDIIFSIKTSYGCLNLHTAVVAVLATLQCQ